IARHPVTVAQFQAFVNHSGYQPAGNDWASDTAAADYPVVDVTWHDALQYCRWQAAQSGLPVTLPSEAEWEKAARGTDGRVYPWGSYPPTTAMCGFQRGRVGAYSPQGDSVYGCSDMAGNVWEWTRSAYRPYPYRPDRGQEDIVLSQPRVVRGVTYGDMTRYARCACRYNLKQNTRLLTLGFRVVVTPH
ncbi:MAG: SUMF1/EgtB/PvdO family nonheme iron enzyme, partial [Anaerolineae bacterium]|nr:SUMF1/EgtB/PvdO family nonheme iron enzyme [Anaerolineae bacterium]